MKHACHAGIGFATHGPLAYAKTITKNNAYVDLMLAFTANSPKCLRTWLLVGVCGLVWVAQPAIAQAAQAPSVEINLDALNSLRGGTPPAPPPPVAKSKPAAPIVHTQPEAPELRKVPTEQPPVGTRVIHAPAAQVPVTPAPVAKPANRPATPLTTIVPKAKRYIPAAPTATRSKPLPVIESTPIIESTPPAVVAPPPPPLPPPAREPEPIPALEPLPTEPLRAATPKTIAPPGFTPEPLPEYISRPVVNRIIEATPPEEFTLPDPALIEHAPERVEPEPTVKLIYENPVKKIEKSSAKKPSAASKREKTSDVRVTYEKPHKPAVGKELPPLESDVKPAHQKKVKATPKTEPKEEVKPEIVPELPADVTPKVSNSPMMIPVPDTKLPALPPTVVERVKKMQESPEPKQGIISDITVEKNPIVEKAQTDAKKAAKIGKEKATPEDTQEPEKIKAPVTDGDMKALPPLPPTAPAPAEVEAFAPAPKPNASPIMIPLPDPVKLLPKEAPPVEAVKKHEPLEDRTGGVLPEPMTPLSVAKPAPENKKTQAVELPPLPPAPVVEVKPEPKAEPVIEPKKEPRLEPRPEAKAEKAPIHLPKSEIAPLPKMETKPVTDAPLPKLPVLAPKTPEKKEQKPVATTVKEVQKESGKLPSSKLPPLPSTEKAEAPELPPLPKPPAAEMVEDASPATEEPKPDANPVPEKLPALSKAGDAEKAASITYKKGKADLSKDDKASLSEIAEQVKQSQGNVRIAAYASGSAEESSVAKRTSLTRALNIRAYLIDKGVNPQSITTQALGNQVKEDRAEVFVK